MKAKNYNEISGGSCVCFCNHVGCQIRYIIVATNDVIYNGILKIKESEKEKTPLKSHNVICSTNYKDDESVI